MIDPNLLPAPRELTAGTADTAHGGNPRLLVLQLVAYGLNSTIAAGVCHELFGGDLADLQSAGRDAERHMCRIRRGEVARAPLAARGASPEGV